MYKRQAIAECIEIDQTIKEMIHDQSSEGEIASYVFDKNPSIDSSCSNLLVKGITSCSELIRSNNIKEDAII